MDEETNRKYIMPLITPLISPYLSHRNTGLGNALFQIASCYGLAKKYNRNIIFNNVYEYCNMLQRIFKYNYKDTIMRNIYNCHDLSLQFNNVIKEEAGSSKLYDTALIEAIKESDTNSIIYGYLEHTNYFKDISDFICNLFQPDDLSLNIIKAKHGYFLDNITITTVSLHFRGHEYMKENTFAYDYYNRAIEYISSRVKNPYFLIFTDDRDKLDFSKLKMCNYILIENDYDYLDLWTMSLCAHNILSISTFSWWGAFLNKNPNKIIIANKEYNWDITNDYIRL